MSVASKDQNMTFLLKLPNCGNCNEKRETETPNSEKNDQIGEFDFDPSVAPQLSTQDQLQTFISGLMSPPDEISNLLDSKLDSFQQKLDHFTHSISMQLETISNRIESVEISKNEPIKSTKPQKLQKSKQK